VIRRHATSCCLLAAIALQCALASATAIAADKPLWEAWAGATGLAFPDYRGSDQTRSRFLPLPFLVYRGEFLRADRNGVRGVFFDNDSVELNASMNASFPVDSRDNRARQGMTDLKPTIEIGPDVDWKLWRSADGERLLSLEFPVRAAVTVQSPPRSIGWVFTPRINLDLGNFAGMAGWNVGLLASPRYGSRRYHEYFYAVAPAEATPWRGAYAANGGYAGTEFLAAVSKRYSNMWVGAFARYDSLSRAVFEDSPLVRRPYYAAAGFAVAWMFGASATMVHDRD
jgi:outer membrane protein